MHCDALAADAEAKTASNQMHPPQALLIKEAAEEKISSLLQKAFATVNPFPRRGIACADAMVLSP